ncbi:hypothetical protein HK405_002905 [Cladochytrium tenue]|nr:hypothetical protein HK405_002905 [Cladochytrium tenue]
MLALLLNWVRRAAGPQARQSEDSQDAGGRASSDIAAAEAAAAVAAAIAQRNPQGRTPLHEAASADAAECVSALLARGADVEAVATPGAIDGGMRPLHLAASAGAVEAVRLLVAAGAAVDARDGKGRTPRMVAEAARNTAVVALMDDAMAETTTAAAPS